MASERLGLVLRHIHELVASRTAGEQTDRKLLQRFAADHDEAAFAEIVQRHGRMVFGVCRRVLGDAHEAEDTFQATFVVLVRKAAHLRGRDAVGNWLYGVAVRTALQARPAGATSKQRWNRWPLKPAAWIPRPSANFWTASTAS